MKRLGIGLLIVLAAVIATLIALRIVGFAPRDSRAGLWLPGEVVTTTVSDWSFTDAYPEIYLQTRTPYLIAHSVTIQCAQIDGQLYIASFHMGGPTAPRRRWNQNVLRDPRVRLSIGGRLYDQTAVPLTDPTEIDAVLQAYAVKYPNWKRVSEQPLAERPTIYYWRIEPA
ncbi:MAG: nitroreductase/quinone reductase family protein [Vicinamibacterales bacterium]